MTKKELSWLLIRIAGLWLLWQAIQSGLILITSYLTASEKGDLLSRSTWVLGQMLLQTIVNLALGMYCVFGGNVLFQILESENVDSAHEPFSIVDLHK